MIFSSRRLILLSHSLARSTMPLLFVAITACGTDGTPSALLYQIDGSSYLLGTIHIGVDARRDLPQSLWQRFDSSTRVGAEAEIRTIDSKEYAALAQLPAGSESLDKLLDPGSWKKLLDILGSGISLSKRRRGSARRPREGGAWSQARGVERLEPSPWRPPRAGLMTEC